MDVVDKACMPYVAPAVPPKILAPPLACSGTLTPEGKTAPNIGRILVPFSVNSALASLSEPGVEKALE